jgi:putative hydrolase of HD superfamily
MKDSNLNADIDFLYEMGNIRYIQRTWSRFLGVDFANLAEHHFRVFWIALVIASHEKDVDLEKIALLSMLHDIAESRTGDVDYLSRQYVERNEELAIKDMLKGTHFEKKIYDLWQEYEDRTTIESKIVKDADNLDIDFELAEKAELQGLKLNKHWREMRGFVAKERLYTTTAKKMFDDLASSNPHNWHLKGRNRLTSGDWKKA